ncbi:MAG: glycoside hydrolase family 3 protein [Bacteroidales bacterium]|nr:glycoside hydrolase family 3 protein [Bacteroidales bacterium]
MKHLKTLSAAALLIAGCGGSADAPQLGKASIDEVIAAMTNEEKAFLLVGSGMAGATGTEAVVGSSDELVPGAAGTTHAIPRLGIPAIVLADGPAGLRIKPIRPGSNDTYYCTAFPIATALASTWDTDLVQEVGKSMGNEVLEYGADVILGPGVNIHRNPLCGRNYEYYSEDPLLAGQTAAAIINGIQSQNVGTSIKHFAVNSQETFRTKTDAHVSQRAIREIYLRQFEIAVRESNPWTVMTSYNKLNGTYTSESQPLNNTILRGEWGFKGLVMTDWFAGRDAVAQEQAGQDLLMPGVDRQYNEILDGLNSGKLDSKVVDANIRRILELVMKSPHFKGYKNSNKPDLKAHAAITRQAAAEGSILLTNKQNTLPFSDKIKKVALFGVTSYDYVSGGIGSGDVNEEYTVSLYEGFKNAGLEVDENLNKIYSDIIKFQQDTFRANPANKDSMVFRFQSVNPDFKAADINAAVKANDVAVITFGRISGEFKDRRIADFYLSDNEKLLLKNVSETFRKSGKKTIVILNVGGVIETASWRDIPDAILLPWMGGQEGGNAVADILTGKVNPSGRLPMSFPVDYFDVPGAKNFPYDIQPNAATLFGVDMERPEGENIDFTNYVEDIYVGYRYYNTFDKKVAFPFGYGLSYTTFALSNLQVVKNENGYEITVDIKNTGKVDGKEVAQLYISSPSDGVKKPAIELKAFAKSRSLKPGESQTVKMTVKIDDMEYFDEASSSWVLDKGTYKFSIGTNAGNLVETKEVEVSEPVVRKVNNVLAPAQPIAQEF